MKINRLTLFHFEHSEQHNLGKTLNIYDRSPPFYTPKNSLYAFLFFSTCILLSASHMFLHYRALHYVILKLTSTKLISLSIWYICWSTEVYSITNISTAKQFISSPVASYLRKHDKHNNPVWTDYLLKNRLLTVTV